MYELWSQEAYRQAYRFAAEVHQGQLYPGTGLPYIMHLSFVSVEIIAALRIEPDCDQNLAVQCALLHDVIEDTDRSFEVVQANFGAAVAQGVLALTKDASLARPDRMADSLRRIRQQPGAVWRVKLADRISNLQSPPVHWSADKIACYRAEAQEIHTALKDSSKYLAQRLAEKIETYG